MKLARRALTDRGTLVVVAKGFRVHAAALAQGLEALERASERSPLPWAGPGRTGRVPEVRPAAAEYWDRAGKTEKKREARRCGDLPPYGGGRVSGEPRGLQNRWGRRSRPVRSIRTRPAIDSKSERSIIMQFQETDGRIWAEDQAGKLVAEITFPETRPGVADIDHTFVDASLRGQGGGGQAGGGRRGPAPPPGY